jgi:glutamine synthetase
VVEPSDGKAYDRDPRSIAHRAEAYLKASGIGDTAYFGPEPEFFIFDNVLLEKRARQCELLDRRVRSPLEQRQAKLEGGNRGHRPTVKGGYFPVPPVDSTQDMRAEMVLILESLGIPVEVFHHEVAGAGQNEIGTKLQHPGAARRLDAGVEVRGLERGQQLWQDRHLHAQALCRRQRLRHARAPVGLERRQEPVCR